MQKSRRVLFFVLSIGLGLAAGIAFAWLVLPAQPAQDASLDRLRADYKTDLVLMTAEAYAEDADTFRALDKLALIDTADPISLLNNAYKYAQSLGYSETDLSIMKALRDGLNAENIRLWQEAEAAKHGK